MKSLILIFLKLLYWSVPLGMFVWSVFQPKIASYSYLIVTILYVGYLFLIDISGRPKPDPSSWTPEEIHIIKTYHLALRYPRAAKDMSVILNGFRWTAIFWVPWLLWNHLWICAIFIAVNFFVSSDLSVKLDPFFFLSDAIRRGKSQFVPELTLLQQVDERWQHL